METNSSSFYIPLFKAGDIVEHKVSKEKLVVGGVGMSCYRLSSSPSDYEDVQFELADVIFGKVL